MLVVNKDRKELVDLPERTAKIFVKRNPKKYCYPTEVQVQEFEEQEPTPPEPIKTPTGGMIEPTKTQKEEVEESSKEIEEPSSDIPRGIPSQDAGIATTNVIVDPPDEKETPDQKGPQSLQEINAEFDATKGAIKLANEHNLNLNDLNIEGRIQQTDVKNHLNI